MNAFELSLYPVSGISSSLTTLTSIIGQSSIFLTHVVSNAVVGSEVHAVRPSGHLLS